MASVRMMGQLACFQIGARVKVAISRRSRTAVRRQRAHPGGVIPFTIKARRAIPCSANHAINRTVSSAGNCSGRVTTMKPH